MNTTAPQIGFDRYIPLDWAEAALRARAGLATVEELNALLDAARLGVVARKKTRTVLNRLWLEPRPELAHFADRAVAIYRSDPGMAIAALTWGMAIASYPFFGKVAELVGRLSALQGDCASTEVHRRMSEAYGEREGTSRMTNMVLQSQASWGVIERIEKGKRLKRKEAILITNDQAVAWIIEAALRYFGKPLPASSLSSLSVIFPVVFEATPGYVASKSLNLEFMMHGDRQMVGLRGRH